MFFDDRTLLMPLLFRYVALGVTGSGYSNSSSMRRYVGKEIARIEITAPRLPTSLPVQR